MKTPAGFECSYFYGDYYRGKNREECRLIGNAAPPNNWTKDLCKKCPVPAIQRANSCPDMVLTGNVARGLLGFGKQVRIKAFCLKTQTYVEDPYIGCGKCHELPDVFLRKDQ